MTVLVFVMSLGAIAVASGLLGSLVGLGGGIIIVPVLTLLFHISIRLAVGASLVAVIATSSGAAVTYVRERLTNLRTGMFLEIGTTLGALSGAYLATRVANRVLFILFAIVLAYSALMLLRQGSRSATPRTTPPDALADHLNLHGAYYDAREHRTVAYKVTGTRLGLCLMYLAGLVSALLGVGSGSVKVPAMDIAMHMPIKASAATSDFMIGVTAAASAGAYFARGQINPLIAAPVAVGVLIGAMIGARLLNHVAPKAIQILLVVVLIMVALEMLQRGVTA